MTGLGDLPGRLVERVAAVLDLGGPVAALLMAMSVLAIAIVLARLAAFARARLGRPGRAGAALAAAETGDIARARALLRDAPGIAAPVFRLALAGVSDARLAAEVETRIRGLERGFRALDIIAQVAPLLGLFGTVLGMIEAFRALQEAGPVVDPAALAGGIWVALTTTAAGLAVAMPVTILLGWLESRVEAERDFLERGVAMLRSPGLGVGVPASEGGPEGVPA
jgi:biopolymer transport protein ExbB